MNIGVVPARLASKRLPKKILADLDGKPMVAHTMEQVLKAQKLDKVILAIDSEETFDALKDFGFDMVMTSKDHCSGTDRVAEVVKKNEDAEVIINIQGDEPLIDANIIDDLLGLFEDKDVNMGTAISTKLRVDDLLDDNVVKAIIDQDKNVIDFKRKPKGTLKLAPEIFHLSRILKENLMEQPLKYFILIRSYDCDIHVYSIIRY